MRIILAALAFIQLIIASLVGLVGLFADGGGVFDRALLALIHPAAALALLSATAGPRFYNLSDDGFDTKRMRHRNRPARLPHTRDRDRTVAARRRGDMARENRIAVR